MHCMHVSETESAERGMGEGREIPAAEIIVLVSNEMLIYMVLEEWEREREHKKRARQ